MVDAPSPRTTPTPAPIRGVLDYLRASGEGPLGWLAGLKFVFLVAVGVNGAFVLLTADDTRSQVIGATMTLLGLLGAAAVWILHWVLITHEREMAALRELVRRAN